MNLNRKETYWTSFVLKREDMSLEKMNNTMVSHAIGYDRIVMTTHATCLRSIVTQIVVSAEQV